MEGLIAFDPVAVKMLPKQGNQAQDPSLASYVMVFGRVKTEVRALVILPLGYKAAKKQLSPSKNLLFSPER